MINWSFYAGQTLEHHTNDTIPGVKDIQGGYSVRTALDILGEDARVVVAELVPAVVEWNRGVLADLAGRPLDDRRTELHEAHVVQLITSARGDYDAIMLDVDKGAEAMVRKGNNWLYSLPMLTAAYAALRRGGVLAIWSAGSQPPFVRRLRRAGFEVENSRCGRVVEAAAGRRTSCRLDCHARLMEDSVEWCWHGTAAQQVRRLKAVASDLPRSALPCRGSLPVGVPTLMVPPTWTSYGRP